MLKILGVILVMPILALFCCLCAIVLFFGVAFLFFNIRKLIRRFSWRDLMIIILEFVVVLGVIGGFLVLIDGFIK